PHARHSHTRRHPPPLVPLTLFTPPPRRPLTPSVSSTPRPPTSPLFPYTTLFRSHQPLGQGHHEPIDIRAGQVLEMATHPEALSQDRKSTRLNSSHGSISYAVFCLKKKNATRS